MIPTHFSVGKENNFFNLKIASITLVSAYCCAYHHYYMGFKKLLLLLYNSVRKIHVGIFLGCWMSSKFFLLLLPMRNIRKLLLFIMHLHGTVNLCAWDQIKKKIWFKLDCFNNLNCLASSWDVVVLVIPNAVLSVNRTHLNSESEMHS